MKGVAARYPVYFTESGRPIDLQSRINVCRKINQSATPFPLESRELLALSAFIGKQSRGMPITTGEDERLEPFRSRGQELYEQRQGQLNLSCAYNAIAYGHWSALYRRVGHAHLAHRVVKVSLGD